MTGYTKLFSSILMSSIWEESTETRLVWVTLLALADRNGHVDGTVKSLARVSRVTINECQRALDCLLGPDTDDRSGVLEGRRLVAESGGWGLVNHSTYRHKMSDDDRRERDRLRKRDARLSASSPQVSENVRDIQQAEAKAKAEAKADTKALVAYALDAEPVETTGSALAVSPTVLTFVTAGATKDWPLTYAQVARWGESYPALDVLAECRKAHAWMEANPTRRKTAKGMTAFLNNWLNRATDRPSGATRTTTTYGDKTSGNADAIRAFIERRQA